MGPGTWRPCVGHRVRVRETAGRCGTLAHFVEEQGLTGRIAGQRRADGAPEHSYLVELDRPYPWVMTIAGPVELVARHYAADELEPFDQTTPLNA